MMKKERGLKNHGPVPPQRGPEPTTERDIGLADGPLKAQPSMGGAVDARGEDAAGLAEGFEFKAGCWGEEELEPHALFGSRRCVHVEQKSIEGKMILADEEGL